MMGTTRKGWGALGTSSRGTVWWASLFSLEQGCSESVFCPILGSTHLQQHKGHFHHWGEILL